jgi:hypothetical protein
LVVAGPLGELDLGNQHWLDPAKALMSADVTPWPHRPGLLSGRFTKGQLSRLNLLQPIVERCQSFPGKACADSTAKKESVQSVVPYKQSAEVDAAAFGWSIAADNELLGSRQTDFDPGIAGIITTGGIGCPG